MIILDSVKMMTKIHSKVSQAAIAKLVPDGRYDVVAVHDRAALSPGQIQKNSDDVDAIRLKLEELGITEADIADAVKWARANPVVNGA